MACLFVDLKDAYNAVNLSVLSSYLGQTGLSEAATNAITGIFTNRIHPHTSYILNRWCQNHGFARSTEKSALLFFCRQRQISYTQLKLNNLTISMVNEIKYLGVGISR
jgi:hypothetical protein